MFTGPNIITDGLVLYLDAANPKSYPGTGTVWSDLSGNGNTGTLTNGPTFDSGNGGSIVFDGVDDSVQIVDEISIDGDWTINYWQRLDIKEDAFSIPPLFVIIPQNGTSSPGFLSIGVFSFTSVNSIHIDDLDNIYVGGQFGGYNSIVRDSIVKINSDGSYNTEFNDTINIVNAGVVTVQKIQELSDGRLVTIGTNLGNGGVRILNSINGVIIPSLTSATGIGTSFIINELTNSMWVLDSWANTYQNQNTSGKIFKISLIDYTIDTNFDSSTGFKSSVGKTTVSVTEGVNDGIVLSDGNLLCVGTFLEYKGVPTNRVVKINSDTADLDTSFNFGTGFNNRTNSVIQMNNGTIVIVGQFTSYNGTTRNRIIGLNNDGTINNGFNIGSGFNNTVSSVIYDSINDKLFCFGLFTTYQGITANRIIKLNSDGSIDTTFNYDTGFNQTIVDGAIDTQGRVVILGGPTLTYQNQTLPRRICRINPDGTLDTTFNPEGFNRDRFRQDTSPRLSDNTNPFIAGFFNINGSRQIVNQPGGIMDFNGFKYYTIKFNSNTNQILTYINGQLRRTTNVASQLPLRCKTIRLFENLFNILIYNKTLTPQEILQNYNATKSRFNL